MVTFVTGSWRFRVPLTSTEENSDAWCHDLEFHHGNDDVLGFQWHRLRSAAKALVGQLYLPWFRELSYQEAGGGEMALVRIRVVDLNDDGGPRVIYFTP